VTWAWALTMAHLLLSQHSYAFDHTSLSSSERLLQYTLLMSPQCPCNSLPLPSLAPPILLISELWLYYSFPLRNLFLLEGEQAWQRILKQRW